LELSTEKLNTEKLNYLSENLPVFPCRIETFILLDNQEEFKGFNRSLSENLPVFPCGGKIPNKEAFEKRHIQQRCMEFYFSFTNSSSNNCYCTSF
jgi:hypothetical protein